MSATENRRLTLADAYRDAQHVIDQLTTRTTAVEPSVSVEITDAAKGEVRVVTKVYSPIGYSREELDAHALIVVQAAENAHALNKARRAPELADEPAPRPRPRAVRPA